MELFIKVEENHLEKYFKNRDLVSIEELKEKLEELDYEKFELEEKIEEIKEDRDTNYKPIPVNEQYEVYESDFI